MVELGGGQWWKEAGVGGGAGGDSGEKKQEVTVVWWWSLSVSDKILLLVPLVVEPSLTAPPVHIIRCSLTYHNNGTALRFL